MATKRVRILVAIDSEGEWVSHGHSDTTDTLSRDFISLDLLNQHLSHHWIEADVPIPEETTIEGDVSDA